MTLTQQELQKLADYLQNEVGIKLEDKRLQRFKRKIEAVLIVHKISDFSNLYHRLRYLKDSQLLQEITNAVTINETYFWREHEQFTFLSHELLSQYFQNNTLPKVRILVSPCSSGEELYSMMIAISEAPKLLEKLYIELVGIDIDSSMIEKAKKGLYTSRSIEKLPKPFLEKYFTHVGSFYHISKEFREHARFRQANIFDPTISQTLGSFDIIFSRNMLIYFDDNDKEKSIQIFHKLLKPNGILFLGHADANKMNRKLFSPLKNGTHIYKKIP